MREQWKVYKDTSNYYNGALWEVSNLGRVKRNGKLFKCRVCGKYYRFASGEYLHVIVAELFIGHIPEGYEVDHIDGNSFNNRVDNLKICTHSENMRNPITSQRQSDSMKGKNTGKHSIEHNAKIKNSMKDKNKGENNPAYGRHWYNNGIENKYDYSCPEGFHKGRLPKSA